MLSQGTDNFEAKRAEIKKLLDKKVQDTMMLKLKFT